MAKSKNVSIKTEYRFAGTKKNGAPKYKRYKVKDKQVSTNMAKGSNQGGKPWSTDEAALKSQRIQADLSKHKSTQAGKTARMTSIVTAGTQLGNKIIDKRGYNANTAVEQTVLGGLTKGKNNRDEDETDDTTNGSSWVD